MAVTPSSPEQRSEIPPTVLEVIDRDHGCADRYIVAKALALGLAVERNGKLYLTRLGQREMSR